MIITVGNNKGGVAKTTTAINLAHGLAQKAKKVLLVDMDRQMNASFIMGVKRNSTEPNIFDALVGKADLPIYSHETIENLYYSPAGKTDIGAILYQRMNREKQLKKLLDPIKNAFDYIIIDCPPSLEISTINAVVASDRLIIPIQLEPLAFLGTTEIVSFIEEVKTELNPNLSILGYVRTLYASNLSQTKDIEELFVNSISDRMFNTAIRKNVALSEASAKQETIFEYAPDSNGAKDYISLTNEIIQLTK